MARSLAVRCFTGNLPLLSRQCAPCVFRAEPRHPLRTVRDVAANERHRLQEQVAETARNFLRFPGRLHPYAAPGDRRSPTHRTSKSASSSTDSHCQLNANLLQIENEYYSFVRPKQIARSGEKPTVALHRRGVRYVEIRALDVDPFSPIGIDVKKRCGSWRRSSIHCALDDSPPVSPRRRERRARRISASSRSVDAIPRYGSAVPTQAFPVFDWAREIIDAVAEIAEVLDAIEQVASLRRRGRSVPGGTGGSATASVSAGCSRSCAPGPKRSSSSPCANPRNTGRPCSRPPYRPAARAALEAEAAASLRAQRENRVGGSDFRSRSISSVTSLSDPVRQRPTARDVQRLIRKWPRPGEPHPPVASPYWHATVSSDYASWARPLRQEFVEAHLNVEAHVDRSARRRSDAARGYRNPAGVQERIARRRQTLSIRLPSHSQTHRGPSTHAR